MSRLRTIITATFVLALIALFYVLERRPETQQRTAQGGDDGQEEIARTPIAPKQAPAPREAETQTPPMKPPAEPAITQAEIRAIRSAAPLKQTVKEEVRENPHVTPRSLIEFAKTLGPPMEKALKQPDAAAVMIGELRDCAANEDVANAARALCVSNTERLAEAHPSLREEADSIRRNSPDEVIRLTDLGRQ